MIAVAPGTKVYLACRPTSMRKGFDGLAAEVASVLGKDPYSGQVFIFRSKRGHFPSFSIRFAARDGRVPVASVLRNGAAGCAFPSRQASQACHHRPASRLFTRSAAVDV